MDNLIKYFIECAVAADRERLVSCSSGNLSMRCGDRALLSATGSWLGRLGESDIAVCDIGTGRSLNGVVPTMESGFHLGIMRRRPDVGCVLHFQSPYATVVSCMKHKPEDYAVIQEIPMYVGRNVPVIPFMAPGSEKLAEAVTDALAAADLAILSNHGQVACGTGFDDVFRKAVFFELACRVIVLSGGYSVIKA